MGQVPASQTVTSWMCSPELSNCLPRLLWPPGDWFLCHLFQALLPELLSSAAGHGSWSWLPVRLPPHPSASLMSCSHTDWLKVLIHAELSQSTGAIPGAWVPLLEKGFCRLGCPTCVTTSRKAVFSPTVWPVYIRAHLNWTWSPVPSSHQTLLPRPG